MNLKKLIQLYTILFVTVSIMVCSYTIQAITIDGAYTVLGLDETASNADVKRAYQKLALKYHPDKNITTDTTEKFKEIGAAYALLKDRAPETIVTPLTEEELISQRIEAPEILDEPITSPKMANRSLQRAEKFAQDAHDKIQRALDSLHKLRDSHITLKRNEQALYDRILRRLNKIKIRIDQSLMGL